MSTHKFTVTVDGKMVAEVEGSDRGQARHEAVHYLLQYANDGKAAIQGVTHQDYEQYLKPVGVGVHE